MVAGRQLLWMAFVLVVLLALPSQATRLATSGERSSLERVTFGMLPRGVPLPPSGPSGKSSGDSPPPPIVHGSRVNFGMLPKGPVPPSGPSGPSKSSSAGSN